MFFILFAFWAGEAGGLPKDGSYLPMRFFTLGSSETEVSETHFFDIVIT